MSSLTSNNRYNRKKNTNSSNQLSRITSLSTNSTFLHDFSHLSLKIDHANRPLWVCPNGQIFLEAFGKFYAPAYDFLIAIAEPVCRPELIHEYKITAYSLYAAASVGLRTNDLINGLKRLSKNELSQDLLDFIREKTEKCGKLRLVLKKGRYFLESPDFRVLDYLLNRSSIILDARLKQKTTHSNKYDTRGYIVEKLNTENIEIEGFSTDKKVDQESAMGLVASDIDLIAKQKFNEVVSFEIQESRIEEVRHECHILQYPCVEEYDFRNDSSIPPLDITLKPIAKHRPYQEKSLSKMFGNGRARSGLIVLPCGAGKTMVGVTAIATVKKSVIIFANTTVSVHQWRQQILHWANVKPRLVIEFSSHEKHTLPDMNSACILVTTYHMLGHNGRRSQSAQKVMDEITTREWGLLVLDEVHVAPAHTFRKCASLIRSKCKLGLTATLLREDNKIDDLYYLIGPKLYEANWLDLQKDGYLANVQCIEVWCPMSSEFYMYYLEMSSTNKRSAHLLSDFNPNKLRAMEYLIHAHEQRGDKVLVFSDNIPLLKHCAHTLQKPYIFGETHDRERKYWLHNFNHTSQTNCLFISSVGDTSIDLPDVNVVIQISSHYGSRRQEAQRLGRILRPKPRQGNEYNAFFYTLVSKDTCDMIYATKRQRFLVDQGYSFHVLTDLVTDSTPGLRYADASSKHSLLQKVLTHIKSGHVLKEIAHSFDDEFVEEGIVNKSGGSLSRLTGNVGTYDEFNPVVVGSQGLLSRAVDYKNKRGKGRQRGRGRGRKRKARPGGLLEAEAKRRKTLSAKKQYLPH